MNAIRNTALVLIMAAGTAGCITQPTTLSSDFGAAVQENLVAQIADPDAQYSGVSTSSGARAGLAQQRYRTGTVIRPQPASASGIGAAGGGGAPPAAAPPAAP